MSAFGQTKKEAKSAQPSLEETTTVRGTVRTDIASTDCQWKYWLEMKDKKVRL